MLGGEMAQSRNSDGEGGDGVSYSYAISTGPEALEGVETVRNHGYFLFPRTRLRELPRDRARRTAATGKKMNPGPKTR